MKYVIRIDASGKELSRTPKGRGRNPKGSEERADGNIYIVEGATITPKKVTPKVEVKVEVTPNKPVEKEVPERVMANNHKKEYTSKNPVKLSELLKVCKHMKKDETEALIVLDHPVIVGDTGIEEVKFNAVYTRIALDKVNKTLSLWGPLKVNGISIGPKLVIHNAFIVD